MVTRLGADTVGSPTGSSRWRRLRSGSRRTGLQLQSQRGLLRLFPTAPTIWQDVAFQTLRAEGAFLVSAERCQGRTTHVEVFAEMGGTLRLRDPFDGARVSLRSEGQMASG